MFRRLRAWSSHRTPIHIPPNSRVHRVRFIKSPLSTRARAVSTLLYGSALLCSSGVLLYAALLRTPGHQIYIPLGFKEKKKGPKPTREEVNTVAGWYSNKEAQERWTRGIEALLIKSMKKTKTALTAKGGPWELVDSKISFYMHEPEIYTQKSLIISLEIPDDIANDPSPVTTVNLVVAVGDRVFSAQQVQNSQHYDPRTFLKACWMVVQAIYSHEFNPPPNKRPFHEDNDLSLETPIESAGKVLKIFNREVQRIMKHFKANQYRKSDVRPMDVTAQGMVIFKSKSEYLGVYFKCTFPPNDPQKAVFTISEGKSIFTPAGMELLQWQKNRIARDQQNQVLKKRKETFDHAAEAVRIQQEKQMKAAEEAARQLVWMKKAALEREKKNEQIRRAQKLAEPSSTEDNGKTEDKERASSTEDEKPDIREQDQQNKTTEPSGTDTKPEASETKSRSSESPSPSSGSSSPAA